MWEFNVGLQKIYGMRFPSPVSIQWMAQFLDAELVGNKSGQATGINEIHKGEPGDLVFVDHPKYYEKCIQSAASFIIISLRAFYRALRALMTFFKAVSLAVDYISSRASQGSAKPSWGIRFASIRQRQEKKFST